MWLELMTDTSVASSRGQGGAAVDDEVLRLYLLRMLEQIRQRLREMPFLPFEVRCSSGDVFRVEHPENAAVVAHSVTIALPDGQNSITLSPLHIVGVAGVDELAA